MSRVMFFTMAFRLLFCCFSLLQTADAQACRNGTSGVTYVSPTVYGCSGTFTSGVPNAAALCGSDFHLCQKGEVGWRGLNNSVCATTPGGGTGKFFASGAVADSQRQCVDGSTLGNDIFGCGDTTGFININPISGKCGVLAKVLGGVNGAFTTNNWDCSSAPCSPFTEFFNISLTANTSGGALCCKNLKACSDGTDGIVYVAGRIYGCSGSFTGGFPNASALCGNGFHVCKRDEGGVLGLTHARCSTSPGGASGLFFGTASIANKQFRCNDGDTNGNDIFGCGDAAGFNHVRTIDSGWCGIYAKALHNGAFVDGPWNCSSCTDTTEYYQISKTSAANGGALCCVDIPCSQTLNNVVYVPGKIYGCEGTFSGGFNNAASLCGSGFHLCTRDEPAKFGLNYSTCLTTPGGSTGKFFGSSAISNSRFQCNNGDVSGNDIFGCGDVLGLQKIRLVANGSCGIYGRALAGGPFVDGAWNCSSCSGQAEYFGISKATAANGGALCCSDVSSASPTSAPSTSPTGFPSSQPSVSPTSGPSLSPTSQPSFSPTSGPSSSPSSEPSFSPTSVPSAVPSTLPSALPSVLPSALPSSLPSALPSYVPTNLPSATPTLSPSRKPTNVPSSAPSFGPSHSPSSLPSMTPSTNPTKMPVKFIPNSSGGFRLDNLSAVTESGVLVMLVFVAVGLFVIIVAGCHRKCQSEKDSYRFQLSVLPKCFVYSFNALTDVLFIARLYERDFYTLAISAVGFILLSFSVSLFVWHRYCTHVWANDPFKKYLVKWTDKNTFWLLLFAIIMGNLFASVMLFRSNLFNLALLRSNIPTYAMTEFLATRVYCTILLEDVPLFIIQIIFLYQIRGSKPDFIAVAALVGSVVSMLLGAYSACTRQQRNRLTTVFCVKFQAGASLEANLLERKEGKARENELKISLFYGLHNKAIVRHLGQLTDVTVETLGNGDDGDTKFDCLVFIDVSIDLGSIVNPDEYIRQGLVAIVEDPTKVCEKIAKKMNVELVFADPKVRKFDSAWTRKSDPKYRWTVLESDENGLTVEGMESSRIEMEELTTEGETPTQ